MLTRTSAATPAHTSSATDEALYYEYTSSANPIGAKLISRVPFRNFSPALYADGATRVVALDLSAELACTGPATGPGLCAHFVRINAGDGITLAPNATSQVFYVIAGSGRVDQVWVPISGRLGREHEHCAWARAARAGRSPRQRDLPAYRGL